MESKESENDKTILEKINKELQQDEAKKEDNYTALSIIGKGAFGMVFKCQAEKSGEIFAIKRVFLDKRYQNRELEIMKCLKHPNTIFLHNYFYTHEDNNEEKIYLNCVMDYLPETLSKIIRANYKAKEQMEPFLVKLYSFQMLKSIEYLHSIGICHRDIKPQNILLDKNTNKLKLCDFGSAKKLIPGQKSVAYICSRYYRAPELIFGAIHYTNQIDVWSMGCVIAELILGRPLFPGESPSDQLVEIIKVLGTPTKEEIMSMNPEYKEHKFPDIKPTPWDKVFRNRKIPDLFLDLLGKLIVYDPQKRLTPSDALKHPFFDELREKKDDSRIAILKDLDI